VWGLVARRQRRRVPREVKIAARSAPPVAASAQPGLQPPVVLQAVTEIEKAAAAAAFTVQAEV